MHSLNVLAAEIARTDIPVLLVGESGTGKDVYARLIHRLSGRTEAALAKINCAALDAGQLLSEVRAAFQSAGDGGDFRARTVFLDGVHELDSVCQRVLLSLLPDGEATSGGPSRITRLISSTSCNFEGNRGRPVPTGIIFPDQWGNFAVTAIARSQGRHTGPVGMFSG